MFICIAPFNNKVIYSALNKKTSLKTRCKEDIRQYKNTHKIEKESIQLEIKIDEKE